MEITKEKLVYALLGVALMVVVDLENYFTAKAANPAEKFNWALAGARWAKGFLGGLGIGEVASVASSLVQVV